MLEPKVLKNFKIQSSVFYLFLFLKNFLVLFNWNLSFTTKLLGNPKLSMNITKKVKTLAQILTNNDNNYAWFAETSGSCDFWFVISACPAV